MKINNRIKKHISTLAFIGICSLLLFAKSGYMIKSFQLLSKVLSPICYQDKCIKPPAGWYVYYDDYKNKEALYGFFPFFLYSKEHISFFPENFSIDYLLLNDIPGKGISISHNIKLNTKEYLAYYSAEQQDLYLCNNSVVKMTHKTNMTTYYLPNKNIMARYHYLTEKPLSPTVIEEIVCNLYSK